MPNKVRGWDGRFEQMIDRVDSPWFPLMRLFRQSTLGDWPGVTGRVASELSQIASGSSEMF